MDLQYFIISKPENTFPTVDTLFTLKIFMLLHVFKIVGGCGAVVTFVSVETVGLETVRTLELVSSVMVQLEVFNDLMVVR